MHHIGNTYEQSVLLAERSALKTSQHSV